MAPETPLVKQYLYLTSPMFLERSSGESLAWKGGVTVDRIEFGGGRIPTGATPPEFL